MGRRKKPSLSASRKAAYTAYILSVQWKIKRTRILNRDGWRCVRCRSSRLLHVHHLHYRNFGNEQDADLVTLCASCHKQEHALKRKKKKKKSKKQSPVEFAGQKAKRVGSWRAAQIHAELDEQMRTALARER